MEHHWKQLQKNRLIYHLNPRMLTNEGFLIKTLTRVIGMPQSLPKEMLTMRFDKLYVYEFFKHKIVDKLLFITKEDFLQFCSDAWDYARQEKEDTNE